MCESDALSSFCIDTAYFLFLLNNKAPVSLSTSVSSWHAAEDFREMNGTLVIEEIFPGVLIPLWWGTLALVLASGCVVHTPMEAVQQRRQESFALAWSERPCCNYTAIARRGFFSDQLKMLK